MNRRPAPIIVGLALVVTVFVWYWASPFFAVSGLRNSALRGDTAELSERVDFVRLREEIKAQLSALLVSSMTERLSGNPFAALGVALAAKMTDVLVDAMVSPAGIVAIASNEAEGKAEEASGYKLMLTSSIEIHRLGMSAFEFSSAVDRENTPTLRFNREGLKWKLVGVQMPKQFLTSKLEGRMARRQPTVPYVAKWEADEYKDPMDDSVTFVLSRGSDEEVSTRFSAVRPTMHFRCRKSKFDAYINVGSSVDYDYQTHRTNVRLRFDEQPAQGDQWGVSKDREAVFASNPIKFLNSLLEARTLQIEWHQIGGSASVAKFTRDDLMTHASRLEDACGKARLVRK